MEIQDWKQAEIWQKKSNTDKDEFFEPMWKWDCNFKLDFDGPILSFSSRFYPPVKHYGPKWDGHVIVHLLGNEITRKEFVCDTLEELKSKAEEYKKHWVGIIKSRIL